MTRASSRRRDPLTPEQRSRTMRAVKSKDTTPEWVVRRLVHGMGFRYRLHVRSLPGQPDLVFPGRKKVIFVNGCFWHGHRGCPNATVPASRPDYWLAKLQKNRTRDVRNVRALRDDGWDVMVVWECETRDMKRLTARLTTFLSEGTC